LDKSAEPTGERDATTRDQPSLIAFTFIEKKVNKSKEMLKK
jgi:hypothetical protein